MASYNRVLLIGNVTREPELKFLQSGVPVCNFGLAMNEQFTDKDGNKQETACFVDCEIWNKQAEVLSEYVSKGDPLFIEGALKFEQWETEDGAKRSRLLVRVTRFQFLKPRDADAPAAAVPPAAEQAPVPAPTTTAAEPEFSEDDIPF